MSNSLFKTVQIGTVSTSVGNFTSQIIGVLLLVAKLGALTLETFGLVRLVFSSVGILSFLQLPGMNDSVVVGLSKAIGNNDLYEKKRILAQYFILRLLLGIVGFGLLYFGPMLVTDQSVLANLIQDYSFVFLVQPISSVIRIMLKVHLRYTTKSFFSVCLDGVKLALVFTSLYVFSFGAAAVVISYVVAELIVTILFLFTITKYLYELRSYSIPTSHLLDFEIVNLGKWAVGASYVSRAGNNFRLWIINFILGMEMVAIFSVARSMIQYASNLFPLSSVLSPIFAQFSAQPAKFYQLATKSIKYSFIGGLLILVVTVVTFPILVSLVFPEYEQSIELYFIMAIGIIFSITAATISYIFHALKLQKDLFFAHVARLFFILLSSYVLISWLGVQGAAVEFALTAIVFALERYRRLKKSMPAFEFSLKDLVMYDELDKTIVKQTWRQFIRLRKKFVI